MPTAIPPALTDGDYSKMVADMANPNAAQDAASAAAHRYQQRAAQQQAASKGASDEASETLGKAFVRATTSVGGFVSVMASLPWIVKRFGQELVEARRETAQFSGNIAAAFANYDVRQFFMGMKTAQQTEGSTLALLNSMADFQREFQPLESQTTTLVNALSAVILQASGHVVRGLEAVLTAFGFDQVVKKLEDAARAQNRMNHQNRTATAQLLRDIYANHPNGKGIGLPPIF